MPTPYSRERSRSPRRGSKPSSGGFKWKDKAPKESRGGGSNNYRDRDGDRPVAGSRYNRQDDRRQDNDRRQDDRRHDDRRQDSDRRQDDRTRTSKDSPSTNRPDKPSSSTTKPSSTKPTSTPKPSAPSEPMIIVHVNDRLGTKAAIPCLASDPVKAFKAMVAARIGRQPHEIMLKRQGERPFKDMLTLEDYGVSNGVQLDLELDTGD